MRVQNQASKCDFGDSALSAREKSILDKIIQCAPNVLRNKLLEKENLSLNKAFQSVNYQAREMSRAVASPTTVNRVYQRPQRTNLCNYCGLGEHRGNDGGCPAWNKFCMTCGNKGHFARCCKKKRQNHESASGSRENYTKRQKVRMIEGDDQEEQR